MIIYKITNKINGKTYIGQTTSTIERRWKEHCKKKQKRPCPLLFAAINKYGPDNFHVVSIEVCDSRDHLNKQEKYWISFYGSFGPKGYNLTSGGDHIELSDISRQKISKALKGKPNGKRGIATNRIPWNKGKITSEETRAKMSISHSVPRPERRGKSLSKAHKDNISKGCVGRDRSDVSKPIICLNNNKSYPSIGYAAQDLNIPHCGISQVLNGKRSQTHGFKFEFIKNI